MLSSLLSNISFLFLLDQVNSSRSSHLNLHFRGTTDLLHANHSFVQKGPTPLFRLSLIILQSNSPFFELTRNCLWRCAEQEGVNFTGVWINLPNLFMVFPPIHRIHMTYFHPCNLLLYWSFHFSFLLEWNWTQPSSCLHPYVRSKYFTINLHLLGFVCPFKCILLLLSSWIPLSHVLSCSPRVGESWSCFVADSSWITQILLTLTENSRT